MSSFAMLFPGQGSQYVGMGKALAERFSIARQTFEEADEALGFALGAICFAGDAEELKQTEMAQPAILTASVAAYRVFEQEVGWQPDVMAGHSLGEFSALTCAGALPFAQAVRLVRRRGQLMQEAASAGTGSMAAVTGIEASLVLEVCRRISATGMPVSAACDNAPGEQVISGHRIAVLEAGQLLERMGAQVNQLQVSAPFHSVLMQPAAERFRAELEEIKFQQPSVTVLSNVTGRAYESSNEFAELLTAQLTEPVRWQSSMQELQKRTVTLAVELGPKTVLRNLLLKNMKGVRAFAYDRAEDREALLTARPSVVERCLGIAVATPNRKDDETDYQRRVTEPYRTVFTLQQQLEAAGERPSREQMIEALQMLRSVFAAKGTPEEEQQWRYAQILRETGTETLLVDWIKADHLQEA